MIIIDDAEEEGGGEVVYRTLPAKQIILLSS